MSTADTAFQLVERASGLLELNRPADAVALLQRAIAAAPTNQLAWCELARAEVMCGRPRHAFEAASRGIALDPFDDYPHRLISHALVALGDPAGGVRAAQEAVRLSPHSASAHRRLAEALDDSPQPYWPWDRRRLHLAAIEAASRAVQLDPAEPDAHNTLGYVHLTNKSPLLADASFREALRLNPSNARALNGLGLCGMRTGRLGVALRSFAAAAATDPGKYGDTARSNIAAAAWKATRRSSWILFGGFLVLVLLLLFQLRWVAAVLVLAAGCWGVLAWRRIPPPARRYLIRLPGQDGWLGVTVAMTALAVLCMAIASLAPSPTVQLFLAMPVGFVALLHFQVVHMARRIGHRWHFERYWW